MRWDHVARAIGTAAAADPTLAGIYGAAAIRQKATAQDHEVPGLQFWLVTDSAAELWEPSVFQFDQWTETYSNLIASERALRRLFDSDDPVTIGGVYMWAMFENGAELTPPDRAGFYGRALRFRFTPIREMLRIGRTT